MRSDLIDWLRPRVSSFAKVGGEDHRPLSETPLEGAAAVYPLGSRWAQIRSLWLAPAFRSLGEQPAKSERVMSGTLSSLVLAPTQKVRGIIEIRTR
ncbi:hypothetical protein MRX96_009302 [Rhipicephalus microplus]